MRFIERSIIGLILCGVALGFASSARADTKDIPAKVVRVKGVARYTDDNKVWHPLKVGMILKPGSVIQTGDASMTDIILGDGEVNQSPEPLANTMAYNPTVEQNLVRLSENTTMALDKITTTETGADTMSETQLDLRAGRIFGTVKKLSATSKYEIKVPNGVAGIRGTIYMVSADGVILVLQGSVMVAYMGADGTVVTQEVHAGYEFDTRTGRLLPLADIRRGELLRFAWQARLFINRHYQFEHDHTIYDVSPIKEHDH